MTPRAPTADVRPLQTETDVNTEGVYDPESSYCSCRAFTDRQTDVVNTEGFYDPESSYN